MKFSHEDRFLSMTRQKGSISWLQILEHIPDQAEADKKNPFYGLLV